MTNLVLSILLLTNAVELSFPVEGGAGHEFHYRLSSTQALTTNAEWLAVAWVQPDSNGVVRFRRPITDRQRSFRVERLEFGRP